MNTQINFELAKLLNSKGLPGMDSFYKNEKQYNLNHNKYTIADVVMWVYKMHGIWIIADPSMNFSCWTPRVFTKHNTVVGKYNGIKELNSPTEAYEAAIEYTLNNLI